MKIKKKVEVEIRIDGKYCDARGCFIRDCGLNESKECLLYKEKLSSDLGDITDTGFNILHYRCPQCIKQFGGD